MELLGIPVFDNDFYKMMIRFLLNLFFLTGIVKFIYYKHSQKKEYLFTFYLIGIVVYFLCFTLKKYELDLGMALGLFAIFGIIRYRTLPLEVKEMTEIDPDIDAVVKTHLHDRMLDGGIFYVE